MGLATGDDAEEILRRADELKRSAQWLTPGWPDARTQEEDLAAHQALSRRFAEYYRRRSKAGLSESGLLDRLERLTRPG